MVRASLNVLQNSTFDISVNSILEFNAEGLFVSEPAFMSGSAKVKTSAIGNLTDQMPLQMLSRVTSLCLLNGFCVLWKMKN